MSRTVTLRCDDGSTHVYQNVPDGATPAAVQVRAQRDLAGKAPTHIDRGRQQVPTDTRPLAQKVIDYGWGALDAAATVAAGVAQTAMTRWPFLLAAMGYLIVVAFVVAESLT